MTNFYHNRMKKYHTVGTVAKPNWKSQKERQNQYP